MYMESIRYFDGEKHIEYSNTQEDVDFISFEEDKMVLVSNLRQLFVETRIN